MRIECPICEYEFDLDDKLSGESDSIDCQSCRKSFQFAKQLVVGAQASTPNIRPTIRPRPTNALPPVPRKSKDAEPDHDNPLGSFQTDRPIDNSQSVTRRRRKSATRQILFVIGSLFVSGALIVALTFSSQLSEWINGSDSASASPQPSDDGSGTLVSDSTENSLTRFDNVASESPGEDDAVGSTAKRSSAAANPPAPSFKKPLTRFLSKNQLDEAWLNTRPHLLHISTETLYGPQQATGVLVDSRGWMVTSYRAIQGATQITVSKPKKSIDDSTDPLTDSVRSVLAVDPEHDLALLLINRRFVTSFQDIDIVEKDRLVGSQHLIHCVAPTPAFPWGASECRIAERKKINELSDDEQATLEDQKLVDDQLLWIVHNNHSPTNPGSLLLTEKGELAGMTARSGTDRVFVIPAVHIAALKARIADKVVEMPLPVPRVEDLSTQLGSIENANTEQPDTPNIDSKPIQDAENAPPIEQAITDAPTTLEELQKRMGLITKSLNGNLPDSLDGEPIPIVNQPNRARRAKRKDLAVLPKDSPNRTVSMNLNKTGNRCREFRWWPRSTKQMDSLKELAGHLVSVQSVLSSNPPAEEIEILRNQLIYWLDEMGFGLRPKEGITDQAKTEFNRQMSEEFKKDGSPFISFVKVQYQMSDSPPLSNEDGTEAETITFKAIGTTHYFLVPNEPSWPVMRLGTHWLVLGQSSSETATILSQEEDDREIPVKLPNLYFVEESDQ